MKEATGELNMTIVTIVAVALILGFVTWFLPNIFSGVENKWNEAEGGAGINTTYQPNP